MSKMKSIREIEMERATQPNFGKGITVASGFDLGAKAPLDSRLTVKTIEERDAHVTGNRAYEGMLVYVEADNKTYQLINNTWEEFGFNEEKFQAGIQPIVDKNAEQDSRLTAIEELVVGGEGEGLESIIADVAANTAAIAKEIEDRTAAVSSVDAKVTAEVSRATAAEEALGERIDGVEADLAEAITNAQADATAKSAQALKDAKTYTDGKVTEINAANAELVERVEANEAALGTVDSRIATAKSEAVESAKTYTDAEIVKIDTAYKAADVQTLANAKSYADTKIDEAKTTLESSINAVDSKVTTLTGKVSANESAISDLRDAISNKNSNTIVVETEDEIAIANANPKVGDLAYVISSKKAYIFKGVSTASVKLVPEGWVVFDEITSELDLVDYLKKSEAESTYRKLADKIAEGDLATELATKINNKADKSYVDAELAKKTNEAYVDTKVEEVVAPVRTESAQNKANIAKEVADRTSEITRVEGLVSNVTDSLTEKETALKAEDTKLNNRINKFVPVVAQDEPTDTEAGHVWLQLV